MRPVQFTRMMTRTVEDLTLGTLYLTTRKRNAWHRTRVGHYRGPTSLKTTWDGAAQGAEQWRAQGSEFVIMQVPAVILHGESLRVAVTEFHTRNSFERWGTENSRFLRRGMRLGGAFLHLGHRAVWAGEAPDEASFVTGALDYDERVARVTTRPKQWRSYSEGGNYRLQWVEEPGQYSPEGTRRIRSVGGARTLNGCGVRKVNGCRQSNQMFRRLWF